MNTQATFVKVHDLITDRLENGIDEHMQWNCRLLALFGVVIVGAAGTIFENEQP